MKEKLHFQDGTTHITYLHKKDDKRHKSKCIHLKSDGSCDTIIFKCIGSSHCDYYKEKDVTMSINNHDLWYENMSYEYVHMKQSEQKNNDISVLKYLEVKRIIIPRFYYDNITQYKKWKQAQKNTTGAWAFYKSIINVIKKKRTILFDGLRLSFIWTIYLCC